LTGWQQPGVLNRRRGLLNDKAAGRARSYRLGNRSGRINAFPRDLMRISIQDLLGCAKGQRLSSILIPPVMGAIADSFVTSQSFLVTRPSCCRSAAYSR
jgi:hypothetical protein